MDRTGAQSVEAYIASQPEAARAALERVRGAIRKAAPEAAESISYKIPTYKIHGVPFLYFAGWKQHYSLYPASDRIIAAFKDDLAMYGAEEHGPLPARSAGPRAADWTHREVPREGSRR